MLIDAQCDEFYITEVENYGAFSFYCYDNGLSGDSKHVRETSGLFKGFA